jgi:FkbM family methyltransferase
MSWLPLIKAVLPYGMVTSIAERRHYARRWPHVARDRGTRELLAGSGLELVPPWLDLNAGVVVDVGANAGDWTAAVRLVAPRASVLALEPNEAMAEALRRRFRGDPLVSVRQVAVSDSCGIATLGVMANPAFSSLRRPAGGIGSLYEDPNWLSVVRQVEVETAPLDELISDTSQVSLLKIDVQGSEREVLAGAGQILSRVQAVLIELLFTPHYEGEASFGELDASLREAGFALHRLGAAGHLADGRLAWTDACYMKLGAGPGA